MFESKERRSEPFQLDGKSASVVPGSRPGLEAIRSGSKAYPINYECFGSVEHSQVAHHHNNVQPFTFAS